LKRTEDPKSRDEVPSTINIFYCILRILFSHNPIVIDKLGSLVLHGMILKNPGFFRDNFKKLNYVGRP
jgi:hypothetical protein